MIRSMIIGRYRLCGCTDVADVQALHGFTDVADVQTLHGFTDVADVQTLHATSLPFHPTPWIT